MDGAESRSWHVLAFDIPPPAKVIIKSPPRAAGFLWLSSGTMVPLFRTNLCLERGDKDIQLWLFLAVTQQAVKAGTAAGASLCPGLMESPGNELPGCTG